MMIASKGFQEVVVGDLQGCQSKAIYLRKQEKSQVNVLCYLQGKSKSINDESKHGLT